MEALTTYAKIALLVLLYFFLSFVYGGVTTVPSEGDSLAYHIPIARSVLDGTVINPHQIRNGLGYYPGSAEVILAVMMLMHLPLNIFNVIGWAVLAVLCFLLARRHGLKPEVALVSALSSVTLLSIVRLVHNQTIDIWLAVFFTAALVLLAKPQSTFKYFLLLGVALGFLIGSKYSGPFYALVLFLFYSKSLLNRLSVVNLVAVLFPILLFGCSWYIRNLVAVGNPLYPQPFLGLPGYPTFRLLEWVGWKTLFFYPNGIIAMIAAFFSEFLLWASVPAVLLYVLIRHRLSDRIRALTLTSLTCLGLFLFLPSTPDNIITYLRYLFPSFIPGILVVFLIADKQKHLTHLLPLSLVTSLLLISYMQYHPKLLVVYFVIAVFVLLKYDILMKYLSKV